MPSNVKPSELFGPGKRSLVIYNFMFSRSSGDTRPGPEGGQTALLPLADGPCASCTALLDQLKGAAEHISQRVNLPLVARAPLPRLVALTTKRGWHRLRLLSSAANTCNRDYLGEKAEGSQMAMLNIFHQRGARIHHFWGAELLYAPTDPGQEYRHVGTIEPLLNLFDLIPEDRGTHRDEQLSYSCCGNGDD